MSICKHCTYEGDNWWRCNGQWRHRPWWKVAVNTFLRFFQRRGPGFKWVIVTEADMPPGTSPPRVMGYRLGEAYHG